MLVAGFMCLISPLMANIYLAGIAYFVMGLNQIILLALLWPVFRTIFMESIPNTIMGRVQTVLGVYTRAMVVLSSLYAGWAIEYHNMSLAINFTFLHFIISLLGILVLKMTWKNGDNIFLKASYNA